MSICLVTGSTRIRLVFSLSPFSLTVADPPIIFTPTEPVILGVYTMLVLYCSAIANPLPRLTWSLDPPAEFSFTPQQPPTGFRDPVFGTATLNLSSLVVGEYRVTCSSEVEDGEGSVLTSAVSTATFQVGVVLENISISVSQEEVVVMAEESFVNVTCSVEASLQPVFSLSQDGELLSGGEGLMGVASEDLTPDIYFVTLSVSSTELNFGTPTLTCNATVAIDNAPTLVATTPISVSPLFQDLTVDTSVESVVLREEAELVAVTCSVTASLPPTFSFLQNQEPIPGNFTPSLSEDTPNLYSVTFNLSTSGFVVGTEVIVCSASLSDALSLLTANTSIDVEVIFQNISIASSAMDGILITDQPEFVTISCSVLASLEPTFTFVVNGNVAGGDFPGVKSEDSTDLYSAVLNISTRDLDIGTDVIYCAAELYDLTLTSSNISLVVSIIFDNLTLEIDPEGTEITPHDDPQLLTLTCTLTSSVTPSIVWQRSGVVDEDGTPPTLLEGSDLTYVSTLSVNDTDLPLPTEVISCSAMAAIPIPGDNTPSLSQSLTLQVVVILENISVSMDGAVFNTIRPSQIDMSEEQSGSGMENGNETELVLTCSVEASMLPSVVWTQNGMEAGTRGGILNGIVVMGSEPRRVIPGQTLVESELTLSQDTLMGVYFFFCTANLRGTSISANSIITFNGKRRFMQSCICTHVTLEVVFRKWRMRVRNKKSREDLIHLVCLSHPFKTLS